jgi:hypothetical protein
MRPGSALAPGDWAPGSETPKLDIAHTTVSNEMLWKSRVARMPPMLLASAALRQRRRLVE